MLHIRFLDRPLGLPILVIYLAAFPACWLLSRYFRSSKNAAKHAKISLLCASFLLYQTWFLCCPTNAELELLPHVRLDQRNAARALDSIVAFCVFSLAIPIGVWLFRRRATYDESEVERDFAGVDVQWHRRKEYIDDFSQHAVTTAWLTLLLCYL